MHGVISLQAEEEAERKRIEEEERRIEEAERLRVEEKKRKDAELKAEIERQKKAGTYMTASQQKKVEAARAKLEAMQKAGLSAIHVSHAGFISYRQGFKSTVEHRLRLKSQQKRLPRVRKSRQRRMQPTRSKSACPNQHRLHPLLLPLIQRQQQLAMTMMIGRSYWYTDVRIIPLLDFQYSG